MPALSSYPAHTVDCPCGRGELRRTGGTIGLSIAEDWCPKCRKTYLVVRRTREGAGMIIVRVLAVVELPGRDAGSVMEALRKVRGISPEERRMLVASAT